MYPLFKVGLEKKPFQVYTQRIVPVNLPSVQETQVRFLRWEDPPEREMATHSSILESSILAWRIPWTEEPGRLQSMRSQRTRHNEVINTHKKCLHLKTYQHES